VNGDASRTKATLVAISAVYRVACQKDMVGHQWRGCGIELRQRFVVGLPLMFSTSGSRLDRNRWSFGVSSIMGAVGRLQVSEGELLGNVLEGGKGRKVYERTYPILTNSPQCD